MVFSSSLFVFLFLPITLIVYFIIFKYSIKASNIWLFIISLLFYSWGEPKYVILMIISITCNYFFGLGIDRFRKKGRNRISRTLLILSLVVNIGLLFYFKYFDFLIVSINSIISAIGGTGQISVMNIALPIGISFFTFQIMSYVIDLYWQKTEVQKNILNLGLYIAMFPQLIAGPIVRYVDINNQILIRSLSFNKMVYGIQRFAVGLFKKIVIANILAGLADIAFNTAPSQLTLFLSWVGTCAYAMQIYFDFSAYSDMAIGLGKMMGFDFKENFNYPYTSISIKDFWRRWHISLSTWFRDYLYIPLGGNRKGVGRTYLNLIIVFAVTGFWHGASWNFVIWGLFFGAFLILERGSFGRVLEKIPKWLCWVYVMLIVLISWVFFRANDLNHAINYLGAMFDFTKIGFRSTLSLFDPKVLFSTVLAILFSFSVYQRIQTKLGVGEKITAKAWVFAIYYSIILLLFIVALLYMIGNSGENPFIYYRF